jgi:uncharacterized protein (DUF2147 family)
MVLKSYKSLLASSIFFTQIFILLPSAVAQNIDSPVGLWKTIDDETKVATSIVRITEKDGLLSGKVERITDPNRAEAKCTKCTDDRKDMPVLGLTILTGLKKINSEWGEGQILDPNNGKIYKAKVKLLDTGQRLEVRGFLGVSLLGRSQYWVREVEK